MAEILLCSYTLDYLGVDICPENLSVLIEKANIIQKMGGCQHGGKASYNAGGKAELQ